MAEKGWKIINNIYNVLWLDHLTLLCITQERLQGKEFKEDSSRLVLKSLHVCSAHNCNQRRIFRLEYSSPQNENARNCDVGQSFSYSAKVEIDLFRTIWKASQICFLNGHSNLQILYFLNLLAK